MSFFDHEAIPQSLIQPSDRTLSRNGNHTRASNTYEDSMGQAFEDNLPLPRNYYLISIDETGAGLGMHSLVQLATSK